jgi:hypothetical protein
MSTYITPEQLTELHRIVNELYRQDGGPTPAQAVEALSKAFKADPEYAWTWHCNIAMAAKDEGMEHKAANRAAARFMYNAFGIGYPEYRPAPEGCES